ncbi:MAG: serine/threonine protein kinase with repeat [Myxococcales bacterium]|nr:serine/threonine protein kinase with repeat [Myxococcales bacterium]
MVAAPEDPSTEILPASATAPAAPATPRSVVPDLIGRALGKFTIVEKLGKGGSGDVYRAEQTQLGRTAVIKVLRHEIAHAPNRVERFLREAKLASRLDHPYAAHIYQFGAEPDGVLWIAMEHIKGMTLDELVARRGPMPAMLFAPLFARLCEVVHTAHELAIVHRDIKGANVMVIERAGQLLPKLLDLGIAKDDDLAASAAYDRGEASPRVGTTPPLSSSGPGELTGHGVTLGSPHYMSPEQWERPAEVDGRADIYALGVLAYRCIAGVLPFYSKDRHQLGDAHLRQAPPPLPEFVPQLLADAVMRALEKRPEARWQTAVGFGEAVSRAVGTSAPETVPIFDPSTRDAWLRAGPQPIADAVSHLSTATTTVEADAALRELVAITCRWLAVLALSNLPPREGPDPEVRDRARAVIGRDDGAPWLQLARAAAAAAPVLPGLAAALEGVEPLAQLAARLDDRDRPRTAAALTANVIAAAEALRPIEPLLAYQLVVGLAGEIAESWQGARRRERERVMVWGPPLAEGEVALLDATGNVVARLSPLAQVASPLPSAEPELFLLWRSGRGSARLVAAPWGFERDDDAAGLRLASLSTEDSDTAHDAADDRSPYPGLAAYTSEDAERFVGREREVETIANRLVRAPLLAVLGPSGVGKSSFIAAGLLPRLAENHRIIVMRPGRHPMHALAALPEVSGDSHDDSSLVVRLRELGESAQRGLVIVIDQLEEIATLCTDPAERRRFAETLAAAADGPSAPVRVVVTLRDDFATVIESQDAFRGRFEVFVLAAPAPEALRRIVVEPARRAAVAVDPQVVEDMVAEVAGRPASLPLLSFTASQLWQTRDRKDRKITHEAYAALGGVAGALATYADQLYASLARRDQDTVRDLFSRLVASDGTRIPALRTELEQLPGARGVLAHLIDARLLVIRDDEGGSVIEIVHECLAERWPRLARWRSEDAADRALLGDVGAAARRWNEAGRRPDLLWRGQALAELRRLTARSTALTELERNFADEAVRAQQRARRMRRGLVIAAMAVLGVIAAVMGWLGVAANQSRAQAEQSALKAHASEQLAEERLTASLVAQGKRELNDGRALDALAYFAAAMKRGADSVGLRTMVSIASRGWRDQLVVLRGESIATVIGSPSGWIAAASSSGVVHYWSDTGAPLGELALDGYSMADLQLLPDDSILAATREAVFHIGANRKILTRTKSKSPPWGAHLGPGTDEVTVIETGAINIYSLDGKLRRSIPLSPPPGTVDPHFDRSGRFVVYTDEPRIVLVDLVKLETRILSTKAFGQADGSLDGSVFGFFDEDHQLHVFSGDGTEQKALSGPSRASGVFFSATGDRVGTVTGRELSVYDRAGKLLAITMIEAEQTMIHLRGDEVWTGGNDGVVRHYRDGQLVASLPVHAVEISSGAIARDALALRGSDGSLAIVRANAIQATAQPQVCKPVLVGAAGIGIAYTCKDVIHVYTGRHHIGDYPVSDLSVDIAFDPGSQRGVLSGGFGVRVFDTDAKPLAVAKDQKGVATFEDADHLFVLEPKKALWRWTFATDHWEQLVPVGEAYTIGAIPGTAVVGAKDGTLTVVTGSRVTKTLDLKEIAEFLITSPDHRWMAAQLMSGTTAIIDTQTWEIVRQLEAADTYGAAPSFDSTGELLLRTSRNALTIWDRSTGELLVFGFDLLHNLANARFLPDGQIETNTQSPGLINIPRDTRPLAEIIRDIECRVPRKVTNSRIEPATTTCPP